MLESPLCLPQIIDYILMLKVQTCYFQPMAVYIYIYINIQLANLLSALHVVFHYDLLTTTVSSCLLYVGFIPVSFFNKG